jgi:hypothetical protein
VDAERWTVSVHEAAHAVAAIQAGVVPWRLCGWPPERALCDVRWPPSSRRLDVAAFMIAGHLGEVLCGLPPRADPDDPPGPDGVALAAELARGVDAGDAIRRAGDLLDPLGETASGGPPSGVVALAGLLAASEWMNGGQLARWWEGLALPDSTAVWWLDDSAP